MSVFVRRSPLFILLGALVGLASMHICRGQTTVSTNPCGYLEASCLAGSDTLLSLPFLRPAAFVGEVQSVSGNVITLSGTPGLTSNQFVYVQGTQPSHYFALLGQNNGVTQPRDGAMYAITSSGTNSLTLNLNGDTLNSVPAGAQVTVVPYWTLNTVFPASNANVTFTPTASTFSMQTQVLIPDYADAGINLASTATYFFYNGAWRLAGDALTVDHGDDVLVPDGYVTVRNNGSAPTLPVIFMGSVQTGNQLFDLTTQAAAGQDNSVGLLRPVNVAISSLGLSPTAGNFTATTSTFNLQDEILLFDNTVPAINKSSSKTYFYYNGGWRLAGDDISNDHSSDVILAGSGFIVRKAMNSTGATVLWTNSPNY